MHIDILINFNYLIGSNSKVIKFDNTFPSTKTMARKLLMSQPSFNSYHTSKPFDDIVVSLKRRAITFVGTSSKLSPFLQ